MKKALVIFAVFILGIATSFAQSRGQGRQKMTVEERVEFVSNKFVEVVGIDNNQKGQIESIWTDFFNEMEASKNNSGTGRPDRSEMREKGIARDNKIKEVLTEEQFALYETKKQEFRARMGKKKGKRN